MRLVASLWGVHPLPCAATGVRRRGIVTRGRGRAGLRQEWTSGWRGVMRRDGGNSQTRSQDSAGGLVPAGGGGSPIHGDDDLEARQLPGVAARAGIWDCLWRSASPARRGSSAAAAGSRHRAQRQPRRGSRRAPGRSRYNGVVHAPVLLTTVQIADVPRVPVAERGP